MSSIMRPEWPSAVGIVGAGRLGSALAMALDRAGYPVRSVWSRTGASRERLASAIPSAGQAESAQALADASDLIFVAIPDDQIATLVAQVRWRASSSVVHCSGALDRGALDAAAQCGARTGSFHPLQSFAGSGGPERFQGVTAAIEGDDRLCAELSRMARRLGCRALVVPSGAKAAYHVAAVMASNYLVALLDLSARFWEPLGITRAEALQALLPLSRGALDNVERLGSARSLTGPIARGDAGTVARHLEALADRAGIDRDVYRSLGLATLRLASEGGTLSDEQIDELMTLLTDGVSQERTASCA
jgi:predicted short-subunit dehydrogenase-like oxidoreductase (DUF2520 family)